MRAVSRRGHRFLVVLTTAPDARTASSVSKALLRERLAACVSRVPGVLSEYVWKGRIEKSREILLVIKTRAALWRRLEAAMKRLHPYEVPEMLALPILDGHAPYLRWVEESTRERSQ